MFSIERIDEGYRRYPFPKDAGGRRAFRVAHGPKGAVMRHGTFRQLEVFDAIMRLGSSRRAAEHLFLSQSTISM